MSMSVLQIDFPRIPKKKAGTYLLVTVLACAGAFAATSSYALDLVAFTGITGPLVAALTTLATLTPAIKALVAVVAFAVALFALSAMRNFGAAITFVGVCIFGAVGLVVGGAIMGATIPML
jgi:hypothetical protein